jgi:hypothetical protein
MPIMTTIIASKPGIKRDGTIFEGDNYTDGQWVRFQRGLPRKVGGYRSISKYLTEVSRGISAWTQQGFQYCHSGSENVLERFTIDSSGNTSIITDRTPGVAPSGSVELTGGASGSVDGITVDGVQIMSGAETFDTDLATTATNVAANINAFTVDFTASAVGEVITITSVTQGTAQNGDAVVSTTTTITTTDVNLAGGEVPLESNPLNMWMFDFQYEPSAAQNYILAHVSPNLSCVCNDVGGQIFYGDVLGTAKLENIVLPAGMNATGGIVVAHPYLVYYGTDGMVGWSVPGDPTDLTGSGSGQARPWSQKFIKAISLRGGAGNAPAALFFAYDAVVRMSFTGGQTIFQFDVIATETSIMSPNCVVDYYGVLYWAGVDRFLMFNGVVREVENTLNLNFFFDNITEGNRPKVFAFKVPRFGEIWWCYPRGDATECTHAVIYNVRENTWYDTALPNFGRSAGVYNNGLLAPILTGVLPTDDGYKVWLHEKGTDEIDGINLQPINSFFTTADISVVASQSMNAKVRVMAVEPDFVQSGPMTLQVVGRANARAPEVFSTVFQFPESASEPYEEIVMLKEQRRELRLTFTSNAVGGTYQMGQIIAQIDTGDHTVLG